MSLGQIGLKLRGTGAKRPTQAVAIANDEHNPNKIVGSQALDLYASKGVEKAAV